MSSFLSVILTLSMLISSFAFPVKIYDVNSFDTFANKAVEIIKNTPNYYLHNGQLRNNADLSSFASEINAKETVTNDYINIKGDSFNVTLKNDSSVLVVSDENGNEKVTVLENQVKDFSVPAEEVLSQLGYIVNQEKDIIKFSSDFQTSRLIVKSKYNIKPNDAVSVVNGYGNLHILQFSSPEAAMKTYENYKNAWYIDFVDVDKNLEISEFQEQEYTNLSWGNKVVGSNEYRNYLDYKGITNQIEVAVIDTGVDLTHPFLKDRIIRTYKNFSSSGVYNSEQGDHRHGSHVSGIIVDNTSSNVKLRNYKSLNDKGKGTDLTVRLGIEAAIIDDVDVINLSVSSDSVSPIIEEVVLAAYSKGIPVVCSAGNNNTNCKNTSPANLNEAIVVSAVDNNFDKASFSNYGQTVDITAPGVGIYSSVLNGGYASVSGTSMSAPFVTAGCALILSNNPNLTSSQVEQILKSNATPINDTSSNNYFGSGLLNLENVFENDRALQPLSNYPAGKYENEISITLTSDENSEIYYTTDGTQPSKTNGILYTQPIVVSSTVTIKAVSFSQNKYRSKYSEYVYNFNDYDVSSNYVVNSAGELTNYLGNFEVLSVPSKINSITITKVANDAFRQKNIKQITLPDTVKEIGDYAFYYCEKLTDITANSVVKIGAFSFANSPALENVNMKSLEQISQFSFCNCISLKRFFYNKISVVPTYALANTAIESIELPNLKTIESGAFLNTYLYNVDLPNVTTISDSAFKSCTFLESVTAINATKVNSYAFSGCSSLSEVKLPLVASVGDYAFEKCIGLENIQLPKCKSVGKYAFYACKYLKACNMQLCVSYGDYAFKDCITVTNVKNVFNDVSVISNGLFYGCISLEDIVLENTQIIGQSAFANCKNVDKAVFDSLYSINKYSFKDCIKLKDFYADTLEIIDSYAFEGCKAIEELYLPGVKTLKANAINLINLNYLYIPSIVTMEENAVTSLTSLVLPNSLNSAIFTDGKVRTIYAEKNSYAQTLANQYNYKFVEIPAEIKTITSNNGLLTAFVAGFDLTYEWYENDVNSYNGAVKIRSGSDRHINVAQNDNKYYFVYAYSLNNGVKKGTTSSIICASKNTEQINISQSMTNVSLDNGVFTATLNRQVSQSVIVINSGVELCDGKTKKKLVENDNSHNLIFTISKNIGSFTPIAARSFVTYSDKNNEVHTVYFDEVAL